MITVDRLLRGPVASEDAATLDRPLDHLVACHRRIEERLAVLERASRHIASNRSEALAAVESCFKFLESAGARHTEDEEQSVFPRLRQAVEGQDRAYLDTLEEQHREADACYAELKSMAAQMKDDEAADLSERFRAAADRLCTIYRAHIASEDATLVEIGRRGLSEEQLALISREMKQRRGLAVAD